MIQVTVNGETRRFATRAEAEAEAQRLNTAQNGDRYRTADFRYWAEESR